MSANQCRIVVIGVGGAGNNAVSRLMEMDLAGAECIALNTDASCLQASKAHRKVLVGQRAAGGRGVRNKAAVGRVAVEESRRQVEDLLCGADIVFITTALGGGTGTGAAPVVAEIAKKKGAVTVAVVAMRAVDRDAGSSSVEAALAELRRTCDTVLVVDRRLLCQFVSSSQSKSLRTPALALAEIVRDLVETVSGPSLVGMDFAGFERFVRKGGVGFVGIGESDAPNRVEEAVKAALSCSLFNSECAGATGALVHVSGGPHMTLEEVSRVGELVAELVDDNAFVAWGARVNPAQEGKLRVTVLMTGLNSEEKMGKLEDVLPRMYNLEPNCEPEKPLGIVLDLYQMEDF